MMSDEIILEDNKYISSKRAASLSGYAQDYIGQLARGGFIEARRVGGLWYISADSLDSYKAKSEEKIPIPPQKKYQDVDQKGTVVSFDGKQYVSAFRAAELTGYNPDYIGQLSRGGNILSRQIGNRWYVDLSALSEHKKQKDGLLAAVQAESVGVSKTPFKENDNTERLTSEPFFKYTVDTKKLLPTHFEDEDVPVVQSKFSYVAKHDPYSNRIPITISRHEQSVGHIVEDAYEERSRKPGHFLHHVVIVAAMFLISGVTFFVIYSHRSIASQTGKPVELSAQERASGVFISTVEYIAGILATKEDYVRAH